MRDEVSSIASGSPSSFRLPPSSLLFILPPSAVILDFVRSSALPATSYFHARTQSLLPQPPRLSPCQLLRMGRPGKSEGRHLRTRGDPQRARLRRSCRRAVAG